MRLFVAEKPDVARELAGYLSRKSGKTPKRGERFIEVGGDIVTWARGHLLEQAPPDHYLSNIRRTGQNSKNGKLYWSAAPLPIIPKPFEYLPSSEDKGRASQLHEIVRLLKQADEIYNATDLDREGQLIFDEIIEYAKLRKRVGRLLFSALNDASFDKAFSGLMDNGDPSIRNRGLAAKARGQADWLIGMNGTRAMTLAHSSKDMGVMNVGRVMVPTLSIVVRRYLEIKNFKPRAFFTPAVTLDDGVVLTWKSRNEGVDCSGIDSGGRIIDRAVAEAIVNAINNGLEGSITEAKTTEKSQEPPLPFSLPVIQSELSKRFGITVDEVTKACQRLYEKKMQTYPGTDCRFLPESMHGEARDVLDGLRGRFGSAINGIDLARKYKCWNNAKVEGDGAAAHHAIIPTGNSGSFDSEAERLVYEAVSKRYIAQFHPEYRYKSISLQSVFGADNFSATARVPVSMGWKAIETDTDVSDDRNTDADKVSMQMNVR